jgi:hypothetical protein
LIQSKSTVGPSANARLSFAHTIDHHDAVVKTAPKTRLLPANATVTYDEAREEPSSFLIPYKASLIGTLHQQAHAVAALPQRLEQISAPAAADEHVTAKRIALEHGLHLRAETVEARAHVGDARGEPRERACGQPDDAFSADLVSVCRMSRRVAASGVP